MKAIQLEKPQSFRAIEIEEPAAPGDGEALVGIHRIGICGTDYSGYLGRMPFYSYPRIPGHELGVEVMAVGPGVTNVKAGDLCSVEPYINCQRCYACRRGLTNCCESNQTLGVMCDGGMCERMLLPARKLHVSTKLSLEQLALVETLAIGCHAVDRGELLAGEHALIVGAGPIGLSAIEFVKVAGAKCIVMDLNEARLAFCRERMKVDH
ncbi:MAG: alcohol dehydrogenase catalytic domain-containing protein, partial [Opitutaceae bacterium]